MHFYNAALVKDVPPDDVPPVLPTALVDPPTPPSSFEVLLQPQNPTAAANMDRVSRYPAFMMVPAPR